MNISFLMDVLLAGLLVAMIVHGVLLNRRLSRLRNDRDELAAVVSDCQIATGQAVAGLDGIRTAADSTGRTLQERIKAGKAAIRDLEFLVERGEHAAERLEAGARPVVRPAAPLTTPVSGSSGVSGSRGGSASASAAPAAAADPRSLLKAIEGMR